MLVAAETAFSRPHLPPKITGRLGTRIAISAKTLALVETGARPATAKGQWTGNILYPNTNLKIAQFTYANQVALQPCAVPYVDMWQRDADANGNPGMRSQTCTAAK